MPFIPLYLNIPITFTPNGFVYSEMPNIDKLPIMAIEIGISKWYMVTN